MKTTITTIVLLLSTLVSWSQVEIPAPLADRPELIIKHTGYTVSYNKDHGTPNWSAWVLTKAHVKDAKEPRSNTFYPDPKVPIAYRVQPSDYNGSGTSTKLSMHYDRGHMCPAADMQWSATAMKECFYMSNMAPQTPQLNRVSWKALESACRKWVLTEDTIYIVAGPVYKGTCKKIGRSHKVDVPYGFFKVVLSLRKGHQKAIGFLYANSADKQSLNADATTIDYIEQVTGINFFYQLPDSLEEQLESRFNLKDWR